MKGDTRSLDYSSDGLGLRLQDLGFRSEGLGVYGFRV